MESLEKVSAPAAYCLAGKGVPVFSVLRSQRPGWCDVCRPGTQGSSEGVKCRLRDSEINCASLSSEIGVL